MVNNATGNKTPITEFHQGNGILRLLASIDLAGQLIDYKPITSFDEGLKSNFDWFNNNWDKIQETADFPVGMSSAVRKNDLLTKSFVFEL